MKRWGTAWPAPEPPKMTVAPLGISRTASSAATSLKRWLRSLHEPATVGVQRLPVELGCRVREQEQYGGSDAFWFGEAA